ncbi:hypothetical protein ACSBR2_020231 [Camellia fascicularis]
MDKPLSVHEKKATKQTKTKKKPVKVVYISNPMRVQTSASEFRALVQELTGQDSVMPEHGKYSEIDTVTNNPTVPDGIKISDDDDQGPEVPAMEQEQPQRSDPAFEPYDDVFMPQMLENFSGFFSPNYFYESPSPC